MISDKAWYKYVDENVTEDMLEKMRCEFMDVLDKSPPNVKAKIEAIMTNKIVDVSFINFLEKSSLIVNLIKFHIFIDSKASGSSPKSFNSSRIQQNPPTNQHSKEL
jgi:hypothetical protein